MAKEYKVSDLVGKFQPKNNPLRRVHREINLVPDVKDEMIKTLKLRNYIFFLCIVVAIISVSVVAIMGTIVGGQQVAIDNKKTTINELSNKLNSYTDLNDFITIKDQLSNISTLTSNKKVLSRTFNILSALMPSGEDEIKISELNVNLTTEAPIFSFDEAYANAGKAPYIDYNVLDAFKKSMKYMRYDYGRYVDKNGNTIPAYCMIETNADGSFFSDSNKNMYAYWLINGEGCNPSASSDGSGSKGYEVTYYDGNPVVLIWRTPQFDEWYKEEPSESAPSMTLDGSISNVPHFESACTTYTGVIASGSTKPTWSSSNECMLVPDGDSGIEIADSSNGRDISGELVLRFSADITLSPEVYKFSNYHMIALAPVGHYNVTDSYIQIQSIFGERAKECDSSDATCKEEG